MPDLLDTSDRTVMVVTAVLSGRETDPQAVLDWLEREARRAGMTVRVATVLPYTPPADFDPMATEIIEPRRDGEDPDHG